MEYFLNILKDSGIKLTTARKQILHYLTSENQPKTLKEIHDSCNEIDFASVYRSIGVFDQLGIVEEFIFADKKIRYRLKKENHSHFIICSNCGEIEELPICLLSEIKKNTNYDITKHNLECMGLCPKCQN